MRVARQIARHDRRGGNLRAAAVRGRPPAREHVTSSQRHRKLTNRITEHHIATSHVHIFGIGYKNNSWHLYKTNVAHIKVRGPHKSFDAICIPHRHIHTCQPAATGERIIPDTRHAVRYRHAHKPAATGKRIIPDVNHTARDRHVHEHAPAPKRTVRNVCHTICDGNTSNLSVQ